MKLHLYTRPACMPCAATKRKLAPLMETGAVVELDATAPENHKHLVERGFTAAPVVMVIDDAGDEVHAWSGFRPDELDRWTKAMERAA